MPFHIVFRSDIMEDNDLIPSGEIQFNTVQKEPLLFQLLDNNYKKNPKPKETLGCIEHLKTHDVDILMRSVMLQCDIVCLQKEPFLQEPWMQIFNDGTFSHEFFSPFSCP